MSMKMSTTVLLHLDFTQTCVQKATARNIHGNAPEQFARASEFFLEQAL